jgi:alkylated DNA nucleotide flippase Atl1
MAKTAVQQRDEAPPPRVEVITSAQGAARRAAGGLPGYEYPPGRMLVASPLEIYEMVERVPPRRVLTLSDLRATLATRFWADYTCPTTTEQFLRIVAEAAHEERGLAGTPLPVWRVVRDDGALIDQQPGGADAQAARLEAEGVDVFRFGARQLVGNVEHYAWTPPPPKRRGRRPVP